MAVVHEAEGRVIEHLGKTKGGKELVLTRKPNCSVRLIQFTSGGQLPECLQGGYSSISSAQEAVAAYLSTETTIKKSNKRVSSSK